MKKIDPKNLEDFKFKKARKKPVVIECVQIDEPFTVKSIEGKVSGKKDDWLMKGVDGELYICDQHIFKKTYDIVD
ncbi:hypothetical protein SAMN03097699_0899 [Flavobacteriaceae bacterium MAR_2010_188]|nr:hypothetical protein SAMN03097699_0899 [Flavobacteriaceae bacterium MAR_2010_188]